MPHVTHKVIAEFSRIQMGDGVVTSMRGPGRPRGPTLVPSCVYTNLSIILVRNSKSEKTHLFPGRLREAGWQLVGSFLAQETTFAWLLLGG